MFYLFSIKKYQKTVLKKKKHQVPPKIFGSFSPSSLHLGPASTPAPGNLPGWRRIGRFLDREMLRVLDTAGFSAGGSAECGHGGFQCRWMDGGPLFLRKRCLENFWRITGGSPILTQENPPCSGSDLYLFGMFSEGKPWAKPWFRREEVS